MAGLMDLRRQILLNTPHLATASGDIVTFRTDMLIPLKSVSTNAAEITHTGANLWGGDVLAEAFRGCTGFSKDTTTKTITFNRAPTSPYHMTLCAVPFKPLTQYTLLAQYSNGGQNTSIMVEYTDGTSNQISFANSSNVKTSRVFVTTANKTVKEFFLNYKATSKTTIYYDESGVFEGVLTYDDFEAYIGETISMTPPVVVTPFSGVNNIWAAADPVTVKYWTHI